MTEKSSRLAEFLDNFGKPPTAPPREIPQRIRVPLFVGMVIVGVIALALILTLWLFPAVRTRDVGTATSHSAAAHTGSPASSGPTP